MQIHFQCYSRRTVPGQLHSVIRWGGLLFKLTLIFVMLYCIVLITTSTNIPPKVILLITRSVNHGTSGRTCKWSRRNRSFHFKDIIPIHLFVVFIHRHVPSCLLVNLPSSSAFFAFYFHSLLFLALFSFPRSCFSLSFLFIFPQSSNTDPNPAIHCSYEELSSYQNWSVWRLILPHFIKVQCVYLLHGIIP